MKSIDIKVHPIVLGLVLATAIPTLAIAAGTILDPPVTVTGSSSTALLISTNSGNGPALQGLSTQGKGVIGQTKWNSTAFSNRSAGVLGQDASRRGSFNSGVRGTSSVGTGVSGSSASGNGIVGDTSFESTSESNKTGGVFGEDLSNSSAGTFNAGVIGTSSVGDAGVYGIGTSAGGVFGTTAFQSLPLGGTGVGGLLGEDLSSDGGHGDFGAGGSSALGTGILGESQSFVSAEGAPPFSRYWINDGNGGYLQTGVVGAGLFGVAAFGLGSSGTNYPALYLQNFNGSGLLIRANNGASDVMSLDSAGNMILTGGLTQHGNPLQDHRTRSGKRLETYGSGATSPTIEDFGTVQLVNGVAQVSLEPAFASIINPAREYLVFLTADGPSEGLYVSGKTIHGFTVRENNEGRSNIGIEYRIVASPLDGAEERLPERVLTHVHPSASFHHTSKEARIRM